MLAALSVARPSTRFSITLIGIAPLPDPPFERNAVMGTARTAAVANMDREVEQSTSRAIAAREVEQTRPRTALESLASRLKVDPKVLTTTLRSTAFSACKTNEEFVALVIVANEYGLNPLLKEIYAFPAKGGGIVPMVSIDGWIRLMNSHPQFDGIEFEHNMDAKGNLYAIEAIIWRKDRSKPIKVMELLSENKRGTEPWKLMESRMLRHRALIQCVRIAFGFSGIAEEGEAELINITPQPARQAALPDNRTMGEQIGDELPAFDGQTGEIIEQKAEAEPARNATTGMTEVSEEDARALDQRQAAEQTMLDIDGPADAEGEGADEESPAAATLRTLWDRLEAATTKQQVAGIEADFLRDKPGFGDEPAAAFQRAVDKRAKQLPNEEG
jgi:phage recombination protein Bet